MKPRHTPRPGFTLIELLVVIAIISVLAAMLLPVLSTARKSARGVQCLNNLRQMVIASQLYANDYDSLYPIAYYWQAGPVMVSHAWDFTTSKDWSQSPPVEEVTPGVLWRGKTVEEVHQCPSFDGAHNWLTDPFTGYNYNTSYIGHGAGESIPEPARTTDVRRPARTALFGDGQYAGGANKFMRAPFPNPADVSFSGRYAGTQGYRHLERTNVAWCDGSAEAWSEAHFNISPSTHQSNIAPGTGFLSPDNSLYDLD
ncbi:MAG: type II secretion system protein [Planctomycetota bacterium]